MVVVTEKYGQIFTVGLESCSENSKIVSGELFLGGDNFSNFSPGLVCLLSRLHL